jgi:hypothetical protein
VRGRVQGDPVVLATAAGFLLAEEPAAAARVVPGLERYVIADDVASADVGAAHDAVVLVGARRGGRRRGRAAGAGRRRRRGVARLAVGAPRSSSRRSPRAPRGAFSAAGARPRRGRLDVARVAALAPWLVRSTTACCRTERSTTPGSRSRRAATSARSRRDGAPPRPPADDPVRFAVAGAAAPAREAVSSTTAAGPRVTTGVATGGRVAALPSCGPTSRARASRSRSRTAAPRRRGGRDVTSAPAVPSRARPAVLVVATLALFLVWSHTFLAFEVLLAPARGDAPLAWLDLVVARLVPVAVVCAAWCFGARRAASSRSSAATPSASSSAG